MAHTAKMVRAALALAARKIAIFPVQPRAKVPACEHGCLAATVDAATIHTWWRERPDCNIGIACGATSGIFAIDIDGPDGECALRELEAEHGELPASIETITPRPGRHVYFKMPSALVLKNSTGRVADHIDVRATGGYTLAPPSIHPSGKRYAWSVDSADKFADAPQWLLDKACERTNGNGHQIATPPSGWRALIANSVVEGQRDNTLTKITGYLLRRYVDPLVVLELVQMFNTARCVPPLPDEDVERIVNSIAGKELKRRQCGNG
jgi:hypothetical protein